MPAAQKTRQQHPSPRRFYQSLYWKLAIAFAAIVLLVGAAQLATVLPMYRSLVEGIDQRVNWDLATDLAEQIQPELLSGFDRQRIEPVLYRYQQINPHAELFLLDSKGKILSFASPTEETQFRESIDLAPILAAVRNPAPEFPVLGMNPRMRIDPEVIFSLAPIRIGAELGYLYVVLDSLKKEVILNSQGQLFIVKNMAIGVISLLFVAACLTWVLFRYLTRSVRSLTEVVAKYGAGDFSQRIAVMSNDEIADLSVAVNSMADRIALSAKQRQEMIASISHDLRSPMTSIVGFVDLLSESMPGSAEQPVEKQQRYLELIRQNIALQNNLITDLFDLSKLESNDSAAVLEAIAADDIVDSVCMRLRREAEAKHLQFDVELDSALPRVWADPTLFERVVLNLTANAIRYTDVGSVRVSLRREQGADGRTVVRFSVADTGAGIDRANLDKIFDSFFRVTEARTKSTGGSGLGLAIVKRALELHGVSVSVESTLGAGSTFSFALPAADK